MSVLIYHRVGGGSRDELDVAVEDLETQLDLLTKQPVVPLDDAVTALEAGDARHRVVVTFDDGFADLYHNAWPLLRERRIPFVIYVASAFIGGAMSWAGSTATTMDAPGLHWRHLEEMVASGLCTVGNHTHTHARPELLTEEELDTCNRVIQERLGVVPAHFAYTWGRAVPDMEPALRARFRSAATGSVGRNQPGADLMRLHRIPVRRTDPVEFFEAKLSGRLVAERVYGATVATAKRVGLRA